MARNTVTYSKSASNKRALKRQKRKSSKSFNISTVLSQINLTKLSLLVMSFFVVFISLKLLSNKSHLWDGQKKVYVSFITESDEVWVTVFDPQLDELTNITIPGNTLLTASRKLGELSVRRLWDLGIQEGIEGEILAESLTHHAYLPVHAYADSTLSSLVTGDVWETIRAVFLPGITNIGFADRAQMAFFSLRLGNNQKSEIDLSRSTYLRKDVLPSGEEGYVVSSSVPPDIVAVFSFEELSKASVSIQLINLTDNSLLARDVGELVEILGGKVISIEEGDAKEIDCIIRGSVSKYVSLLTDILKCEGEIMPDFANGDIEIILGTMFAKRY